MIKARNFLKLIIKKYAGRFFNEKWDDRIRQRLRFIIDNFKMRKKYDYLNLPELNSYTVKKFEKAYAQKGLDEIPDTFVIYRIIGNDLYPRHKIGQSRENVKFILENEPKFEHCEKRWIINRIFNREEETAIIKLLEKYDQPYLQVPFKMIEYKKISWDFNHLPAPEFLMSDKYHFLVEQDKDRVIGSIYRLKNNYVMNNNGARNIALRDGKKRAKWILPWDGNTYLTKDAWNQIIKTISAKPYLKYFVVPMTRITDNSQLLDGRFVPSPVEEPQIIFRVDSIEEFNEEFYYGRRPKVELFWRLSIPGKWDYWRPDPWDIKSLPKSKEKNQFGVAGWVARLNSGMNSLEQDNIESFKNRGRVRQSAVINTLRYLDQLDNKKRSRNGDPVFIDLDIFDNEICLYRNQRHPSQNGLIDQLLSDAGLALNRIPSSVVEKTTLPPSGNIHDYWHPAPYWWPNPKKSDGLPYIKREGKRVPGTELYEPDSNKYDRTRLQFMFDDTTILTFAWKFTNNQTYVRRCEEIIERFFINPETYMTPHLEYAQVQMGHNKNKGNHNVIIEMKDFYYFLDSIMMLKSSELLSNELFLKFTTWLKNYFDWLLNSPQGHLERKAINNHGTFYDLQVGSIANFLDEKDILHDTLMRALSRMLKQFTACGEQPEELRRNLSAHYCCFNFQGWIYLADLADRWGVDFWNYQASNGATLKQGANWLISFIDNEWPYQQISNFDRERLLPILFKSKQRFESDIEQKQLERDFYQIKPIFHPHDGIKPYWNLGNNISILDVK